MKTTSYVILGMIGFIMILVVAATAYVATHATRVEREKLRLTGDVVSVRIGAFSEIVLGDENAAWDETIDVPFEISEDTCLTDPVVEYDSVLEAYACIEVRDGRASVAFHNPDDQDGDVPVLTVGNAKNWPRATVRIKMPDADGLKIKSNTLKALMLIGIDADSISIASRSEVQVKSSRIGVMEYELHEYGDYYPDGSSVSLIDSNVGRLTVEGSEYGFALTGGRVGELCYHSNPGVDNEDAIDISETTVDRLLYMPIDSTTVLNLRQKQHGTEVMTEILR